MENRKVKRGDIFCYNFGTNDGSIQNGIRPALVIQTNNFNVRSTTTVIAAITTAQKGMYILHIFFSVSVMGLTVHPPLCWNSSVRSTKMILVRISEP